MSTYTILNAPLPTIGYCILHQAATPKLVAEYAANMVELHSLVRRESAALDSAYRKFLRDSVTRESQVLRGALAEFLATPVRSDNQSVQRIFADCFERFQGQIAGATTLGITGSSEGKVVFPPSKKAPEKSIFASGKTYLRDLGLAPLKTRGDVFESVFVVEGGMNLDLLEYIIRDRLGIYATVHGNHLRLLGGVTFSAYNLVGAWGQPPEYREGLVEFAFFFSKPNVHYAPFRAGLQQALEHLSEMVSRITLWQRKLGFGKGREFIVRCLCEDRSRLSDILTWLQKDGHAKEVRALFLDESGLLMKELIA